MAFNPSLFTATNKPIGLTGAPVDARTYYYDGVNFVFRAYVSTAEVLAYLLGNNRIGQFSIIINTGGTLVNGVITGGTNAEWWFKDGISDGDLVLKGSGGGGTPGGNNKDVQFNNAGSFAGDDHLQFDNSTPLTSLYKNVVATADTPGNKIVFLGDSISADITTYVPAGQNFPSLLCALLGFTKVNLAGSGASLEANPVGSTTGSAGYAMVGNLSFIPAYDSSYSYLIFEFGINDVDGHIVIDPTVFTLAQFTSDYATVLNNAITTKGWPSDRIILLNTFQRNDPASLAYQLTINTAISNAANTFNTLFLDVYNIWVNGGTYAILNVLTPNTTHPNIYGHQKATLALAALILSQVFINEQSFAANGPVEFRELVYRNFTEFANDNSYYPIGIDNDGNVGVTPAIKSGTMYNGLMNIMGQMVQWGAQIPTSLNPQDFIMLFGARIISAYPGIGAFNNSLEVCDSNAGMNTRTSGTGAYYDIYNGSTKVIRFLNGYILQGGAPIPDVSIPSSPGDIWGNYGNVFGSTCTPAGNGVCGKYSPIDINGNSYIDNTYFAGNFAFRMSGGTNGATIVAFQIDPQGRVIFQLGGTFTAVPSARMAINSTTEGFLPPRMTTTEKNAILSPEPGLMIFDRTLGKLCVANNSSVWETITSV